jgi:hypothetical protein|tara:strand:+ start:907 stop:1068 length:162 start_codon:yes stop_codon:yes gene_type:complete
LNIRYINLAVLKLIFGLITRGEFPVRAHLIKLRDKPGDAQGDANAYDSCPALE